VARGADGLLLNAAQVPSARARRYSPSYMVGPVGRQVSIESVYDRTADRQGWLARSGLIERPGTLAARKYPDDVPLEVKKSRLAEVIRQQNQLSFRHNQRDIGKVFEVLVEGPSRRSDEDFCGRNSQNKMVVFPKENTQVGQYVKVKILDCTAATLKGLLV
jgi:hypothetical protein